MVDEMRAFLRPGNLFLLTSYLALSVVPFAPLLFGRSVENMLGITGVEVAVWASVWAIFKRPAWFHWMLLPAFLALPMELYLNIYYNQGISTHHLGIITETSPGEALEFLGDKIWLFILIVLSVVAWWAVGWGIAWRTRSLDWSGPSRWLALALFGATMCAWFYQKHDGVDMPRGSAAVSSNPIARTTAAKKAHGSYPMMAAWAKIPFDLDTFGTTWPFGLVMRGIDFWKERQYLAELAHKSTLFTFGAAQASAADLPQVVVMAIGESSRYDRWSLNGYRRETNPLLKKETNLVSLSNVITAVSATRLSVPVLVSRKPATQSLQAGFSEKSFLTAFKEAGFKTWWISNQMSFGQFDTPISVFAKEADVTQFLNFGGFTNTSSFDSVLLDPLKAAIADPAKKKLIVLHTLGSHWNYSHRYPREFDHWQPSLFGIENPVYTDAKLKPQLNNSYDNSILYTDWFLSQVIAALKATRQMSSMMYVADHGQTLYDGTCKLAFHGHNTQFEFHVPALIWYSNLYRTTHPAKVNQLLRNKHAKLATENVFHSLLDMADIRYGGEHLEWSFLSRRFRQHKRYVDSYGWTDYDNSTFRGDCREVIDKGKPMAQVK